MKSIVFDTGPIISLVTNNLLWILEPLKARFGGEFYITPAVKHELIDKAFATKRFEFEALQVSQMLKKGALKEIYNEEVEKTASTLLNLANHSFRAYDRFMTIVDKAEIETLAADALLDSDAVVIDERTARLMLENPNSLAKLLELRLHVKPVMDEQNIAEFRKMLKNVQIIRSTELVAVAYKLGILDKYLAEKSPYVKDPKKQLLDAALWAVKVRGCSVSKREIEYITRAEK